MSDRVWDVTKGEHWRDHVVVSAHDLARILGVDPKALVLRVWAEHESDYVHLLAGSSEEIKPGYLIAKGGTTDQRHSYPSVQCEEPGCVMIRVNLSAHTSLQCHVHLDQTDGSLFEILRSAYESISKDIGAREVTNVS